MKDQRIIKLAEILVNHSIKAKKEDKVLIEVSDHLGLPLAEEIYKQVLLKKAYPYLALGTENLSYFFYKNAVKKQLTVKPEIFSFMVDWADKFVRIKAGRNETALASIEPDKILAREKAVRPVMDKVLQKPWVLVYYPTESMAQTAKMSLEELEDFYYQACLQDWRKIGRRLEKIKKIMDNARKIEVTGQKTHLTFSLQGRLAKVCSAEYNMPDGEVYSAPLDGTMEGEIYFEFPSLRYGKEIKDIWLKFTKGRVIDFSASQNQDFLAKSLKIDSGASRPGEFAFGANYGINRFMHNTLFDEKIGGTIHLALGRAYDEKEGGGVNKSAIHWDLVKDMRKKGSQVKIDGKIILKDGKLF